MLQELENVLELHAKKQEGLLGQKVYLPIRFACLVCKEIINFFVIKSFTYAE